MRKEEKLLWGQEKDNDYGKRIRRMIMGKREEE